MNLKNFSCAGSKVCALLRKCEGLIASTSSSTIAASPIGASCAIASGGIARIARALQGGVIAAEPTGDDPALGRGIIAAVGQEAVAWRIPVCAAVLQTCHQQVANQRGTADRNCECRHLARHQSLSRKIAAWRFIVHRKVPALRYHSSPNVAIPFIVHSSGVWNFCRDGPLYPLSSVRFRKVTS